MSNTYNFVKFCNQNIMDIKDELLKSFILNKLDENYYLKKKKIITEEELELIKNNKYPIYLEFNSYRVIIFLTKYQSRNYCIMIDQNIPNKLKMLITKLRFNYDLYEKDTIFEGEIIQLQLDDKIKKLNGPEKKDLAIQITIKIFKKLNINNESLTPLFTHSTLSSVIDTLISVSKNKVKLNKKVNARKIKKKK